MDEDRTPLGEPQDSNPSEHPHEEVTHEPSSQGSKITLVLIVMIACIAVAYGWLQHDAAARLASERGSLNSALSEAKSQEDVLSAKVNALTAAQAQEQREEAARAQQEELAREQAESAKSAERVKNGEAPATPGAATHRTHSARAAHRAPAEDPRWKQVQQALGDQQKALAENQKQIAETQANLDQTKTDLQGNLESARTELGGDIARNHGEVVALEKKGERNYFEFSFDKSKEYHHTGPISISLRKTDTKHSLCDLDLVVDDKDISRKHISLYESIALYPEGYTQPVQVVINHIDKDSIHGYVSEPKYQTKEQATATAPATPAASLNTPENTNPTVNPAAATNPPANPPAAPEGQLEHRGDASADSH